MATMSRTVIIIITIINGLNKQPMVSKQRSLHFIWFEMLQTKLAVMLPSFFLLNAVQFGLMSL